LNVAHDDNGFQDIDLGTHRPTAQAFARKLNTALQWAGAGKSERAEVTRLAKSAASVLKKNRVREDFLEPVGITGGHALLDSEGLRMTGPELAVQLAWERQRVTGATVADQALTLRFKGKTKPRTYAVIAKGRIRHP